MKGQHKVDTILFYCLTSGWSLKVHTISIAHFLRQIISGWKLLKHVEKYYILHPLGSSRSYARLHLNVCTIWFCWLFLNFVAEFVESMDVSKVANLAELIDTKVLPKLPVEAQEQRLSNFLQSIFTACCLGESRTSICKICEIHKHVLHVNMKKHWGWIANIEPDHWEFLYSDFGSVALSFGSMNIDLDMMHTYLHNNYWGSWG